jgi:cytidylate kinase
MFVSPSMHSNYYIPRKGDESDLQDTDQLFEAETEILKGIAEEESCVIAGRSGFHVFNKHPNHVSILIQASLPFRLERVMRKQGLSEKEALKAINKVDQMRENYVKKHTGTSRYDTRNYDIVIKADGKTEDEIVDIIMMYLK